MGEPSKYWTLVGINSFGKCLTAQLEEAKAFFHKHFPEQVDPRNGQDRTIQRQLVQWFHSDAVEDSRRIIAELCLRCFISNEIKQVCLAREKRYGKQHNFTSDDLLPLVLDEIHSSTTKATNREKRADQSLTAKILPTFDPDKSSLSTWTTRMVQSYPEFKRFLLEHGIEEVSDWVILNNRTSGGLQRILSQFYRQTSIEIQQAVQLLESYHQVYRCPIRSQRRQRGQAILRRRYPQPTPEQLRQIAELLESTRKLTPEEVLTKLQNLARLLRDYRIYTRIGICPTQSLDTPGIKNKSETVEKEERGRTTDASDELTELLNPYIDPCLVQALEQVIEAHFNYLQGKKPQKAENYLKGLHLFHCQGIPMGKIAPLLGWNSQSQVSRLLELDAFRADVKRRVLVCLKKRIFKLAQASYDLDSFRDWEQKVMEVLEPRIDDVIQEAEREASTSKNRVMNSQFSQTLCQYLQTRRGEK